MLTLVLTFISLFFGAWPQTTDLSDQFNQAVALQQAGKLTEAAEKYRIILKRKPDYAEAQANLGVVLGRLGQNEEAVAAYETALKLAPQFVQIWLNLGILYYRTNEFEKAINAFDKFLAVQPQHLQARQLLGLSLIEIGYNTAGIEQLKPTLAAAPQDVAVLYSLGLAYVRLNRMKEAEETIGQLATASAGQAVSYLLKGQLQLARFEFEKAILDLQKAQILNPDLPRLNYSLGLCYYKLGQNKEALAAFTAEIKQRPKDFTTIYYLALLHEAEGNLEPAAKYAEIAIGMQPDSVEVLNNLAWILATHPAAALHLAAAAQTPCVAVFSSRDWPGSWYPYGVPQRVFRTEIECEGCYLTECVERKNACLNRITVAEVAEACSELLMSRG